jgi:hypothetical protein
MSNLVTEEVGQHIFDERNIFQKEVLMEEMEAGVVM